MKLNRTSMLFSAFVAAVCMGGPASAKDNRDEITIIPGGAHLIYDKMERGKTSAGKEAMVFTGNVKLNIHKEWETNAIYAMAERIDVIPLSAQYNVFGPGEVHLAGATYKSDRADSIFTFYQSNRQGQIGRGWHKV